MKKLFVSIGAVAVAVVAAVVYAVGPTTIGEWKTTGPLRVFEGTSGVATINDFGIAIESDENVTLNFMTPNDKFQSINFGDPEDNDEGSISFNHNTSNLDFITEGAVVMTVQGDGDVNIGGSLEQGGEVINAVVSATLNNLALTNTPTSVGSSPSVSIGTYLVTVNWRINQLVTLPQFSYVRLDHSSGTKTAKIFMTSGHTKGGGTTINIAGTATWVITTTSAAVVTVEMFANISSEFAHFTDSNGVPDVTVTRLGN